MTTPPVLRLADRILAEEATLLPSGIAPPFTEAKLDQIERMTDEVHRTLRGAPIFVADNVADYVVDLTRRAPTREREVTLAEELPNVAPPYRRFWIDINTPTTVESGDVPRAFGFLFEAEEPDWQVVRDSLVRGATAQSVAELSFLAHVSRELKLPVGAELPQPSTWPVELSLPSARWAVRVNAAVEIRKALLFPLFEAELRVEPDGTLRKGGVTLLWRDGEDPTKSSAFQNPGVALSMLHAALLTVVFLHTKNVEVVETNPPPKLSRARERKGKPPLLRYHTLVIEPMKHILRTEGGAEKSGIAQALHITRGHFKTFSGRGLFGRHRGTYWWPEQSRGDAGAGAVQKGYDVRAPAEPGDGTGGKHVDEVTAKDAKQVPAIGIIATPTVAAAPDGLHWRALRRREFRSVEQVRDAFGLKAIPVDIRDALRKADVEVSDVGMIFDDHYSAELQFTNSEARILVVNTDPETRRRFSLAAMLYHLLNDSPGAYTRQNGGIQSDGERRALAFASDLLMPLPTLRDELARAPEVSVRDLARRFGVSEGALTARLSQLDDQTDPLQFEGLEPRPGETLEVAFERKLEEYAPARFENLPNDAQAFAARRREALLKTRNRAELHKLIPGVLRFDTLESVPSPDELRVALREARALIQQKGWCQGHPKLATDAYGKRVSWDSPRAYHFSALGALRRAGGAASDAAEQLLANVIGGKGWRAVSAWNDEPKRTREEVVAALDDALSRLA